MSKSALIGIDLGKHSFHLHGQDTAGREVFHKKLSRPQMMQFFGNLSACTVVMEACAGAHFVARQLIAMGHQAKLISPQFVRPFVKGNKNDFVDAEAICEAASRPSMRFVTPKTEAQQTLSVLHRMRESLVHERTKTANQMHGFLLEFGISLSKGLAVMKRLASILAEHELPARLTVLLQRLHEHFSYLDEQIKALDKELAGQLAELGDLRKYDDPRKLVAAAGLNPKLHDSGLLKGRSTISKIGSVRVRAGLYMPGLVALQHNEAIKAMKDRLKANGKAPKQIICAAMRKLLHFVYGVLKSGQPYDSKLALAQ
ncbi:IS110 family transposase [Pseudomonas mandelii]|uniref:IS110 family transposase n=1 Tax=Pseudomonas mandelii TaxID=75612 RepID=UPI00036AF569